MAHRIEVMIGDDGVFPSSVDPEPELGLHEGWAEDYHGNYTSVDDDPAAKAEVNRLLESGYVKCFESRGAGEAWVGGKVCLSKLGLITKVHPITGKVKCRLILDCKQSHVNQRAWKGGRLLLPRVTDVLDDTLGLLRQAEGTDSGVEWLVLDYSDWFFQIPLHPKERRHVAFAYKAKGKFAVYTVQAQGSLNAPVVCGRVAALVARLTQGAFGESALKLQIYVDDPCIGVCGSNAQRDVNLSALILMWRASSFTLWRFHRWNALKIHDRTGLQEKLTCMPTNHCECTGQVGLEAGGWKSL